MSHRPNRDESQRLARHLETYRDGLLEDTLPFWLEHSLDPDHGGFMFCVDRDGTVIDTDKGMWQHGRFVWLLSTLCTTVERNGDWLDAAASGTEFIRRHGFDEDGRAFFQVTRDGKPLVKRRYIFTETFYTIALTAYAHAAGDEEAREEATGLFRNTLDWLSTPGALPPKVNPDVRPMKGLVVPMILTATAQVLRESGGDPDLCDRVIGESIAEIERDFVKGEFEAVLETTGPNGEFLDHFQGRMICPGHAIEAAWFILHEAKHRGGDQHLIDLGTTILDWMFAWGWDDEHGGILYYRDVKGLPVTEYWHDMKFWWPHNETIIATLLAFQLTGKRKYLDWHQRVHDWTYRHFPDPEHGEWYGYLHRDGSVASRLKGNIWKGPFHLPRMQLMGWKLIEEILSAEEPRDA